MCGEKSSFDLLARHISGSPPRVRGKESGAGIRCVRGGITPACAGKRFGAGGFKLLYRDHPRVCGEKLFNLFYHIFNGGSPPRVRGKVDWCKARTVCAVDHPRVCGEKLGGETRMAIRVGSPPRVRGKVVQAPRRCAMERITPACAGKSHRKQQPAGGNRDHPRVCGEKGFPPQFGQSSGGSPPRVRGKAFYDAWMLFQGRITPACAGKRLKKAHKIKDFDPVPI